MLLATRSAGKLRELKAMLDHPAIEVFDLTVAGVPESPDEANLESADVYEENALRKALHFHNLTQLPTIADDSGIEVAALGGAPGVHSKRWSGRADLSGQALDDVNNALLLERLARATDRRAKYVCAAAYCDAEWQFVERGEVAGAITRSPRGTNGFGYDPYFESSELGKTFGEASADEKASVSHRARAFGKLLQRLQSRG